MNHLPFTPLNGADARIIVGALSNGQIASGPELAALENEMSAYFGSKAVPTS